MPTSSKPRLLIDNCNPDRTVAALRDALAQSSGLLDRGGPVRLVFDKLQERAVAQALSPNSLVLFAHGICRPYVVRVKDGNVYEADARLPLAIASMYLDWRGEWNLPPLNGISSAPLLQDDGTIRSAEGYDASTGIWCENVPDLTALLPEKPTKDEAAKALLQIRNTFKTFCFGDADVISNPAGSSVVDVSRPPARDESAVCRASLRLAPAAVVRAPQMSGAGAGKGLLARCICIIAFGAEPHAVTGGASAAELDKRIAAELIEAHPALFLDNLNNMSFASDLLASAITERPAKVRVLGKSQMLQLNATAFVILTGNGITISEDLARRFITVELDPRTENPEARPFTSDILTEVRERRKELLAAALTIWRWGRIAGDIGTGLPFGSFGQWSRWVRDPLVALGCKDPVERVSETKERDSRRQEVTELFALWADKHGDRPVTVQNLDDEIKRMLDPQQRGRQYLSAVLTSLSDTRIGGYVLTRQAAAGKWGKATYALKSAVEPVRTDNSEGRGNDKKDPYEPDAYYAPQRRVA